MSIRTIIRRPRIGNVLAVTVLFACATMPTGHANEALLPGETVRNRPDPSLDAKGLPLGAFRLFPSAELDVTYDSNTFALPEDELEDWIFAISPRLELRSDWVRHALVIESGGRFARFQEYSSEDVNEGNIAARLVLDMTSHSRLGFSGRTARTHEDRASPDDVRGLEPTPIDTNGFTAEYAFKGESRFRLRLRGTGETFDFHDVPGLNGNINNDDRDRTERTAELRLAYEITEGLDLGLEVRSDTRDYDIGQNDPRLNRSSDGDLLGIGLSGALTGKLFADFVVGNTKRNYDDPSLASIDTPWYDGRFVWNPSGLTSITFRANRFIRETTIGASSGFIARTYELRVDHELRRNVLVHVLAAIGDREYVGIERDDDVKWFGLGARYKMNRQLQFDLDFRQRNRDPRQEMWQLDRFDKGIASLTVRLQF